MLNRRRLLTSLTVLGALVLIGVALAATPSRAATGAAETRRVADFDRVRLEGAFDAEITAGGHATQVVVSAESSDAVQRVITEVSDRTLLVKMRPGSNIFAGPPLIEVTLPVLRGFANAGAGSITLRGLTGADIEIENDGAASITASGHAARETIGLNGTGKIDTTAVDAHDVTVDNNGVGVIRVRASGSLWMNVNGVGDIRYAGKPAQVDRHINGIGRISPL